MKLFWPVLMIYVVFWVKPFDPWLFIIAGLSGLTVRYVRS